MLSKTRWLAIFTAFSGCISTSASYAGLCGGMSPGASSDTIPTDFVNQGTGFYRGAIEDIFVKVFAGSDGITAIDLIYDNDPNDRSEKIPQKLTRRITLVEAIKAHSYSQFTKPTFFGYAKTTSVNTMIEANAFARQYGLPAQPIQTPRIYGIVDVDNQIVFTTLGPVAPETLVSKISYVLPGAPVITGARRMPVEQGFLSSMQSTQTTTGTILTAPPRTRIFPDGIKMHGSQVDPASVKMPNKMKDCISVRLLEKGFEKDIMDKITLRIGYKNLTPKDIRGFKGDIVFKDMFGDAIKTVEFKVDDVLPAMAERSEVRTLDFNRFRQTDGKLLTTSLENLTVGWDPRMIIFTDGTSVKKQVVGK